MSGLVEKSEKKGEKAGKETSLRALLHKTRPDVHVGTCVMPQRLGRDDQPYADTVAREFNLLVAEHHMKWEPLLVNEKIGCYDWKNADKVVDFAAANSMEVKGHTLCWHITTPKKWAEDAKKEHLREELYNHIKTTVGHFYGRVSCWDVVNEALHWNAEGGLQDNVFLKKLGPTYIEDCFRVAHQADPTVKLIYNDNKVEGAGLPGGRSAKADAFYDLAKGMTDKGVPLHGVGMQAHFCAGGEGKQEPPTPHSLKRQIHRLGKLKGANGKGLEVNISEMDIRLAQLPKSSVDPLETQRVMYRDHLLFALSEPCFKGVTFWGFSDKCSWVHAFYGKDLKVKDRPLLFDDQFTPKPAYDGVAEAFSLPLDGKEAKNILASKEDSWGHQWKGEYGSKGGEGGKGGAEVDVPDWKAGGDKK